LTGRLKPGKLSPGRLLPGKLPPDLLSRLLSNAPILDGRVVLGAGIGLDCAVVDAGGDNLLVFKSDPITFTSDQIGWYAVQVNANDIATTGAVPRWMLVTALLPEGGTDERLVMTLSGQLFDACRALDISVIGGHTEITHGLARPILACTLIGEVQRADLVTPRGARPGNRLLLTKGVPIEATAILAREFPERLRPLLGEKGLRQAADFLYYPGISVVRDARLACQSGRVTAMHDPTEGGLAAALWELAEACGASLVVDPSAVAVLPLSARICQHLGLDPLSAIASGALLLACEAADASAIRHALQAEGIACAEIGRVEAGAAVVRSISGALLERPARDEITKVYA